MPDEASLVPKLGLVAFVVTPLPWNVAQSLTWSKRLTETRSINLLKLLRTVIIFQFYESIEGVVFHRGQIYATRWQQFDESIFEIWLSVCHALYGR